MNIILRADNSRKTQEDVQSFVMGNEQGNELRKQTLDYIELFNEIELPKHVKEIRTYH